MLSSKKGTNNHSYKKNKKSGKINLPKKKLEKNFLENLHNLKNYPKNISRTKTKYYNKFCEKEFP